RPPHPHRRVGHGRLSPILVTGVAVLDIVFALDSFPDKPEKYRANDAYTSGGGNAANAAVAIARLGGAPTLAARLGDDDIAGMILRDLDAEGVATCLTRRFPSHRSSVSSIFTDASGERQIVNYRDTSLSMDAAWLRETSLSFDAVLADTRWPDGAVAAMQMARDAGTPGVLDAEAPALEAPEAMRLASHVAFSAQGLRAFAEQDDLLQALHEANRQLDGIVSVTDGAAGSWVVLDETLHHVATPPVEAVDTLGAGDVWHGALALALAGGHDMLSAMRWANAAGALKCTRTGGRDGYPRATELEEWP
ncbi:MAG: PfkB family carbohydrate kinase, partial [Pseudomonadota bacterium]